MVKLNVPLLCVYNGILPGTAVPGYTMSGETLNLTHSLTLLRLIDHLFVGRYNEYKRIWTKTGA